MADTFSEEREGEGMSGLQIDKAIISMSIPIK